MTVDLTAIEKRWLLTHTTGVTSQTPLNDIKRKYFVSEIGGTAADVKSLNDLERQWLRKVIVDASGTPSVTIYTEQLWKEAVSALGYTVSKFLNENKTTFYLNKS
jgi:hypothetical protein